VRRWIGINRPKGYGSNAISHRDCSGCTPLCPGSLEEDKLCAGVNNKRRPHIGDRVAIRMHFLEVGALIGCHVLIGIGLGHLETIKAVLRSGY
jgi:hypothetical protein